MIEFTKVSIQKYEEKYKQQIDDDNIDIELQRKMKCELVRACELQVISSRDFILNPTVEKLGFIAFDSWVLSNNEIPSVVHAIRCDELNELNP